MKALKNLWAYFSVRLAPSVWRRFAGAAGLVALLALAAAVPLGIAARYRPEVRQRITDTLRVLRGDDPRFEIPRERVSPEGPLKRFNLLIEGSQDLEDARQALVDQRREFELSEDIWTRRREEFELRLNERLKELETRETVLAQRQATFDRRVAEERQRRESEGYQRNLQLFSKMLPQDVTDVLWPMSDDVIAAYLLQIKGRMGAEILATMVKKSSGLAPDDPQRDKATRIARAMELNLLPAGPPVAPAAAPPSAD